MSAAQGVRRSAFLSYGNHQALLMLRAYFDESGHMDDPNVTVVSVGGCIAPLTAWERFEGDWVNILRSFCISQLHMKHFAHGRGEFEGWSESKRQMFLGMAMELMDRDVSEYVGAVMSVSLFQGCHGAPARLGQPVLRLHPFIRLCLDAVIRYANPLPAEEKVEIVCARHSEYTGLTNEMFALYQEGWGSIDGRERLSGIAFFSPVDVVPLQAADLVAYELRQHLTDEIKGKTTMRWPMQQIHRRGLSTCDSAGSKAMKGGSSVSCVWSCAAQAGSLGRAVWPV